MIVLSILLSIAVIIIGFLGWYSLNALRKIQFISHSIEDLDLGLQSFEKHLKYIYELDMYYGDQTLEGLIAHIKDLNGEFTEFRKDYDIFNGEINEKDFFEEEDNTAEEKNSGEDLLLQRP